MSKPTLGSLFAGIGGIDLGFERQGFETTWQVEIDPFCRRVLAKNFPNADRSVIDVKCGNSKSLPRVDVLAGGFPCQDISVAGRGAGITGARSGLWKEFPRIIGDLRPRYVLVENVEALLRRGMGTVLGDLAEIRYDAEWEIIPARWVGARHLRKRIWIVAYPQRPRLQGHNERPRIFSSEKTSFPLVSYDSFRGWGPVDKFIAGLPDFDGLSVGMVRNGVRALGNSVVPQIPEYIAGLILEDMKRPENGQEEE